MIQITELEKNKYYKFTLKNKVEYFGKFKDYEQDRDGNLNIVVWNCFENKKDSDAFTINLIARDISDINPMLFERELDDKIVKITIMKGDVIIASKEDKKTINDAIPGFICVTTFHDINEAEAWLLKQ